MDGDYNALIDELRVLARKNECGAITPDEKKRFSQVFEMILSHAGRTPLAQEMTQVYQLPDILKADGAKLNTEESTAVNMALFQAGKNRLSLFAAMKTIQRTHLITATQEDNAASIKDM